MLNTYSLGKDYIHIGIFFSVDKKRMFVRPAPSHPWACQVFLFRFPAWSSIPKWALVLYGSGLGDEGQEGFCLSHCAFSQLKMAMGCTIFPMGGYICTDGLLTGKQNPFHPPLISPNQNLEC